MRRVTAIPALLCAAIAIGKPDTALAQEVTFSYGVDITSNYISKGTTQTDDKPALQPYIEVGYGLFYAGLWGSNVDFGATDIELDVYFGFAQSWGDVDFDIGFAQYLYRDDSTNYGEVIIQADWGASDRVTLGLDYYREVYFDENWFHLGASLSGLPWELTLSGGIASDFGSRDLGSDKNVWDIGLSRDITDNVSISLDAYGGNLDDETLVLTLSFFN
jgi:uncharacterized protein (TIGR02001 family)